MPPLHLSFGSPVSPHAGTASAPRGDTALSLPLLPRPPETCPQAVLGGPARALLTGGLCPRRHLRRGAVVLPNLMDSPGTAWEQSSTTSGTTSSTASGTTSGTASGSRLTHITTWDWETSGSVWESQGQAGRAS